MIVTVNKKGESKTYDVIFSIGDVVKVTNYGGRYANQQFTGSSSSFVHDGKKLYLDHEISTTDYELCNVMFSDIEWKIIDVGYYVGNYFPRREIMLLLRNREKKDMLFVYDPREPDEEHDLKVVRKSKKEIENYTVNIN